MDVKLDKAMFGLLIACAGLGLLGAFVVTASLWGWLGIGCYFLSLAFSGLCGVAAYILRRN